MTIDNTAREDRAVDEELEKSMWVLPIFAADATTAAGGSAPIATIFGFTGVFGTKISAARDDDLVVRTEPERTIAGSSANPPA